MFLAHTLTKSTFYAIIGTMKNQNVNFETVKHDNPRLRILALVGGAGTGKTVLAKKVATLANGYSVHFDKLLFEFISLFPEIVSDITHVSYDPSRPDFNAKAYFFENIHKSFETYAAVYEEANKYSDAKVAHSISELKTNPSNVAISHDKEQNAIDTSSLIYGTEQSSPDILVFETAIPSINMLQSVDRINLLVPSNQALRRQAVFIREQFPKDAWHQFDHLLDIAIRLSKETTDKNLKGLRYIKRDILYVPDNEVQSETDKLALEIKNDFMSQE